MITIDSILSKKNTKRALEHLALKKNGGGTDISPATEIEEFWNANAERVCEEIRNCRYQPGPVTLYEIVNGKGKKRTVSKLGEADRLITRLLSQKLNSFLNPMFFPGSHAYQDNKGTLSASEMARDYIEQGNEVVVELDISNFFDEISLERLMAVLADHISDKAVLTLLERYLYCTVLQDGTSTKKTKGIVQGSSISPVLSNLYLHALDELLTARGYKWVRFADDLNIYVASIEEGNRIFAEVSKVIESEFFLSINDIKSGVYNAFERRFLGFDYTRRGKRIFVTRHSFEKKGHFREWHPCVVEKINHEYHIVKDGVLNKKDYALLFENKEEKHHIPIETTDQINLYNEVVLTSSVLSTLSHENIRLAFFDRNCNLMGYFVPEGYSKDSKTVLAQTEEYNAHKRRLDMAKRMEIAAMHNIRANIRYHMKHGKKVEDVEAMLTLAITEMNNCKEVDSLLLIEARCRQAYYQAFNIILNNGDFEFSIRSKQPPKDEINALISFGNTLMYNQFQQIIWKTSLDSRIGVFHAANRRHYSLNLDFADMFKPLVSDRVIFSLINKGQIRKDDFDHREDSSVYLSDNGKKCFIEAFEYKLNDKITVKDKTITYKQLMENEVYAYQRHILDGEKYKPYKYY